MAIQSEDIEKLKKSKELINEVLQHVNCKYCRGHLIMIMDLLDSATDISKFNLLYANDEKALEQWRHLMTESTSLRLLALGSKVVGFFRRLKFGKLE
jgi:hypothetical protein